MPGYETTLSSTAEILASTLALCYSESFVPGSNDWSVHLRACRTVINTLFLRNQEGASTEHPAVAFLVKEVTDLETLSNISIFNQECVKTVELPLYSFHNSCTWTFTQLLNDITNTERRRHAALKNYQIISEMDMTIWHARADQAYNEILTGPCFDQLDGLQHYFEAVLCTHFYANLIYSYQAFASPEALVTVVESCFDLLIENIQIVVTEATQSFSHDLFFLLFIAGTECRGDQQRQSFVEQLFLDIIFATGVWCNHTALQFLRGFWARSETEVRTTWIQYARANEEESGMFIAF
ncbi:hypothetical protein SLS60_002424 [Paraconiothyrium brasiliense]|uniref:Uncharacterized protein n=1 Tax=Paraconiothyrium brasiliense TaxID=300254 RepID=A0ABR3S366_9PLEO